MKEVGREIELLSHYNKGRKKKSAPIATMLVLQTVIQTNSVVQIDFYLTSRGRICREKVVSVCFFSILCD